MQASEADRDLLSGLRFAVLCGGFLPKHPGWAAEIIMGGLPALRSLHVYGDGDRMVSVERAQASVLLKVP